MLAHSYPSFYKIRLVNEYGFAKNASIGIHFKRVGLIFLTC